MINHTDIQTTIRDLFIDFDNAELINPDKTTPSDFKKIIVRMIDTNHMLKSCMFILNFPFQRSEFRNATERWFPSTDNLDTLFSNVLLFYILEYMEFIKQLFMIILKTNTKCNGESIKKTDTLGNLLLKFSKMFDEPRYTELLNNKLRIAIAHSNYWWKDSKLVYKDKRGNSVHYDIFDEYDKIAKTSFEIIRNCQRRGFLPDENLEVEE